MKNIDLNELLSTGMAFDIKQWNETQKNALKIIVDCFLTREREKVEKMFTVEEIVLFEKFVEGKITC